MGVQPAFVSLTLDAGQSQLVEKTVSDVPIVIKPVIVKQDAEMAIVFKPHEQRLVNGTAQFEENVSVKSGAKPGSILHAAVDFLVNGVSLHGFIQKIEVNVPKHHTSLSVANVNASANPSGDGAFTLSATLTDSDAQGSPIAGATIQFSMPEGFVLDNGGKATTNDSGVATCGGTFAGVTTGYYQISASFAGDSSYYASQGTGQCLVYTIVPSGSGSYTIGQTKAIVGNEVTFWGPQWCANNGFEQPDAFKGYATSYAPSSPSSTSGTFNSMPGNRANKLRYIPEDGEYMGLLVVSSVQKSGSKITGNYANIVIVQVNSCPSNGVSPEGKGKVIQFVGA